MLLFQRHVEMLQLSALRFPVFSFGTHWRPSLLGCGIVKCCSLSQSFDVKTLAQCLDDLSHGEAAQAEPPKT